MPYPAVDLSQVRTYSLLQRPSRVAVEQFITPSTPLPPFDQPELDEVAERLLAARRAGAPLIWHIGGHVVKRGLAPLLIDLMERGCLTHLASNGAAAIHDFEIALIGQTSEDVAASLSDGSFGMAEETGAGLNQAIRQGVGLGAGIGEAIGAWIAGHADFRYRQYSLAYNAYRLGIPYSVHVAIGTDIIHQHPLADFAAIGWGSGQDFKVFTQAVTQLEGGAFCNFGSAVIGPEVFLKALAIARNLGHTVRAFTTANFDLLPLSGDYRRPLEEHQLEYYYRPRKNIVNRPTALGGRGYHICGDHSATIPHLASRLRQGAPAGDGGPAEVVAPARPAAAVAAEPAACATPASLPAESGAGRLARSRLSEILQDCRQVRLGVIGDFTLDAYWYADMTRSELSREAPLFPRPVTRETYSLGGAANVAWNAAALGLAQVEAFTVFGPDWRREALLRLLAEQGIGCEAILTQPGWQTPLFGKVILSAHGLAQEDSRLDFINSHPLPAEVETLLLARLEARLPQLQALVVADYQPVGILSEGARAALSRLAGRCPHTLFVADARLHIGSFSGMVLKPNRLEAARLLFPDQPDAGLSPGALAEAATQWATRQGQPLVITQGEQGCLLCTPQGYWQLPAVRLEPPIDPVGAGDTFLACLAACLAAGATPWEACWVANLAAAVTVKMLRVTGTATPEQILALYDRIYPEGAVHGASG